MTTKRPKGRTPVSFKLDEALRDKFRTIADADGKSMTELIEAYMRARIDGAHDVEWPDEIVCVMERSLADELRTEATNQKRPPGDLLLDAWMRNRPTGAASYPHLDDLTAAVEASLVAGESLVDAFMREYITRPESDSPVDVLLDETARRVDWRRVLDRRTRERWASGS